MDRGAVVRSPTRKTETNRFALILATLNGNPSTTRKSYEMLGGKSSRLHSWDNSWQRYIDAVKLLRFDRVRVGDSELIRVRDRSARAGKRSPTAAG